MTNPTISGGGLAENMKRLKDACRRFQFLAILRLPRKAALRLFLALCRLFWQTRKHDLR